jgi:lipoprotein-releasing system ATP-binding protein
MTELLRANDVVKSYHDGERELKVLRGATLSVDQGEAVAVVGMSGSGKSTLLHLLGGLDVPDKGEILFEGKPLGARHISKLDDFRNRSIGYVFQFHHLLPEFSAVENVIMPALIAGARPEAVRQEATQTLERLGLGERIKHRPSKLSGGEQQRVALARALINKPAILLADEPTGNLDVRTGEKVIELMWEMTVKQGRGLIIVTHEPTIAMRADRILYLTEGRLQPISAEDLPTKITKVQR